MRVLHIEIEQFALEQHTVPAEYSGVNIWTAKHPEFPGEAQENNYLEKRK
ncbi:hypothetical protein [Pantoea sp. KPR_PJ]